MVQTEKPNSTTTPRPYEDARWNKWTIISLLVVAVLIAASLITLHKIDVAHQQKEVAGARAVSDKAILAVQARNGAAARKLGTKSFQSTYTDKQLTDQFKAIEVATSAPPKLEIHMVRNSASSDNVYFIYKYDQLKVPYYVRTLVVRQNDTWQLSNITGNIDEGKLFVE
jgi:hypothetical protein